MTVKLIDELLVQYILAIRRTINILVETMKNSIWATYFYKISTKKKPRLAKILGFRVKKRRPLKLDFHEHSLKMLFL